MDLCNLINVSGDGLLTDFNKLGALDVCTVANDQLCGLVWGEAQEMLEGVILESFEASFLRLVILTFVGKLVGLQ